MNIVIKLLTIISIICALVISASIFTFTDGQIQWWFLLVDLVLAGVVIYSGKFASTRGGKLTFLIHFVLCTIVAFWAYLYFVLPGLLSDVKIYSKSSFKVFNIQELPLKDKEGNIIGMNMSYSFTGAKKLVLPKWGGYPEVYDGFCPILIGRSDYKNNFIINPAPNRTAEGWATDPNLQYTVTVACVSPVFGNYDLQKGWYTKCLIEPGYKKTKYKFLFGETTGDPSYFEEKYSQQYTTSEFDHQSLYNNSKIKHCSDLK